MCKWKYEAINRVNHWGLRIFLKISNSSGFWIWLSPDVSAAFMNCLTSYFVTYRAAFIWVRASFIRFRVSLSSKLKFLSVSNFSNTASTAALIWSSVYWGIYYLLRYNFSQKTFKKSFLSQSQKPLKSIQQFILRFLNRQMKIVLIIS